MGLFKQLAESFKGASKAREATAQNVSNSGDYFWASAENELAASLTTTNRQWLQRYHEMIENDYLVRAFAATLQLLFSSMSFSIEEDEEEEDEAMHEMAEQMFTEWAGGDWNEFLRAYVSTFLFGFSVFEVVLRKGETGYEVDDMAFHPQVYLTADWENTTTLRGFHSSVTTTPLDINRLMYSQGVGNFNHNVYGQSLLRAAYIHYRNKFKIMGNELYHVKANLEGIPVIKMDTGTDGWQAIWDALKAQLKAIKLGHGAGVMLPSNTYLDKDGNPTTVPCNSIELMSVGGSKFIDTNELIKREDNAIARALMAEFLVMVGQDSGSYALSKETTSMFKLLVEGMAQQLCDTFNHQVIKPIWVMNGQDLDSVPKLTYDSVDLSLESMAVFINALTSAGVTLSDSQQDYLFDYAGLPKPSAEERLEQEAAALMMAPNGFPPNDQPQEDAPLEDA